jgi:hypothetical protein
MCTCSPCRACEARGEGEGDSDWKYQLQAEIVVPVPLHRAVRAGDVHIEVQNAGVGKKLAERLCDPHCLWSMPPDGPCLPCFCAAPRSLLPVLYQ